MVCSLVYPQVLSFPGHLFFQLIYLTLMNYTYG